MIAVTGLLPPARVGGALASGTDVYLFLTGMMLLAELARREGVFAWVAARAVRACGGSRARLFAIVYGTGVLVTIVLSNDATAVVLTPAVAHAARAAKVDPLPYLFACAFVANAASFVLPISNPANLVVFAGTMPPLASWLAAFTLPSLAATAITYAVLRIWFRRDMRGACAGGESGPLSLPGTIALAGVAATALALATAAYARAPLGAATLIAATLVFAAIVACDRSSLAVLRDISWSVLPLVAGLFVVAQAAERTGLATLALRALKPLATLPQPLGAAYAGLGVGIVTNAVNNLPAALIAAGVLQNAHASEMLRNAVAIGIDLGPNLSVTGSLATILWLVALRRERIETSSWHFLRIGAIAMPLAVIGAAATLAIGR